MRNEKNGLFTIGQFAKLHSVNKKTLMWYAEIGLLKPACIKKMLIVLTPAEQCEKAVTLFQIYCFCVPRVFSFHLLAFD